MSKSAQTRRNLAFYFAADSASFFRQHSTKTYLNAWTSIPEYLRKAYIEETRQLKDKKKISDLIDEFRELDGLYNSVVWNCLDPKMTLSEASRGIRDALKISKVDLDIHAVIENLLSDAYVYKCTPLNHVAALLCCLRHTYKNKKLYPELCVRLARAILMLNASHINRWSAAHIWECCDINLVKKFKYDGYIISFNDSTLRFAEGHISNKISDVSRSMFPANEYKHIPTLEFKRELIKNFVDEIINLDPDVTRNLLVSIHKKEIEKEKWRENAESRKAFMKIDSSNIGLVRYL